MNIFGVKNFKNLLKINWKIASCYISVLAITTQIAMPNLEELIIRLV